MSSNPSKTAEEQHNPVNPELLSELEFLIQEIRKSTKQSIDTIAASAGFSRGHFYKIRNGQQGPDAVTHLIKKLQQQNLRALSESLGITQKGKLDPYQALLLVMLDDYATRFAPHGLSYEDFQKQLIKKAAEVLSGSRITSWIQE